MKLVRLLIVEEWRLHSGLFGSGMLAVVPILVALAGYGFARALPLLLLLTSARTLVHTMHLVYFFLGLQVGAFGLYARELLNRRFGQASLLSYAARTLPVSDRRIILSVVAKDVTYYIGLWILPLLAGAALAAPAVGISQTSVWLLFATVTLSFLLGLSIVFTLSTVYVHSRSALFALVALGVLALTALGFPALPTTTLYATRSVPIAVGIVLAIVVLCGIGVLFPNSQFPQPKRQHAAHLRAIARYIPRHDRVLIAKDLLDLARSGGIGRLLFGLGLPLALIWWFVQYFATYFPQVTPLLFFGIMCGCFTPVVYQWLTQHDSIGTYSNLPVRASDVIRAKRGTSLVLIALVGLVVGAAAVPQPHLLLPALVLYLLFSLYVLDVTIALTGLMPQQRLLNAGTLVLYLLAVVTPAASAVLLAVFAPLWLASFALLLPGGFVLYRLSLRHWDAATA